MSPSAKDDAGPTPGDGDFKVAGLALCAALRLDLGELALAGDDDVAGTAGPAAGRARELGALAEERGQEKMARVCALMARVLGRIENNAALAKPSILGLLGDALDKLEAMAGDPARSARVDVARTLFQLELACGPSRARH